MPLKQLAAFNNVICTLHVGTEEPDNFSIVLHFTVHTMYTHYIYAHTHTHTHMHARMHAHTHTHMHTRIHTHINKC